MRKIPHIFIMALIAILSLTGCGGGDWEDINPPPETAKAAEKAFHEAATDVFRDGSGTAPGLEWSRDASVPVDHFIVRFGERVIYDEYHWFVYGHRGQMIDGTDVVLVHEYAYADDSGRSTLFVGGRRALLPDLRIERTGANLPATLRNVREFGDGWLIGFASYDPISSTEVPVNYVWILYHVRTGRVLNLGEYCGACTRR